MQERLQRLEMVEVHEVIGLLETEKLWGNLGSAGLWSHGVFFLHALSIPAVSRLLSPTSYIFAVVLRGRIPVCMRWPTMTCMRTEGWRLVMPGWWVSSCFVLFPFWGWVRTAGVFFGSEQKPAEGCQILAMFTYFPSLQVNLTGEQKVSGGYQSAVRSPGIWRKLWNQLFSATWGWEEEEHTHPEWRWLFEWELILLRTGQNARILFYNKIEVWLLFLFHVRKKQKPFHCWNGHAHKVEHTLDYR